MAGDMGIAILGVALLFLLSTKKAGINGVSPGAYSDLEGMVGPGEVLDDVIAVTVSAAREGTTARARYKPYRVPTAAPGVTRIIPAVKHIRLPTMIGTAVRGSLEQALEQPGFAQTLERRHRRI